MSAMNIDRPLDEMVADARKKKASTRGRKAAGAPRGGKAGASGAAVPVAAVVAGGRGGRGAQSVTALPPGDKVVVSNLPQDVTEAQVKDLFVKTVGPVQSVSMVYDSHGKSKGTVTVHFRKPADTAKAYTQYNGRLIDGQRALKVEIIYDPTKAPPAPLTSRLGAAPKAVVASSTVAAASGAAGAGRSGGRRGRGRGRRGGADRPKVTAESLDQEMDSYHKEAETVAK